MSSPFHLVWDAYIEYLWNHQPGSWVARIASTFRVLAFLVVLPVVVLTLLDVISYVIARTLGIVDDVKASTSDATGDATMSPSAPTPILMQDSPPAAGGVDVSGDPSLADGVAEDQHRDHIHGNEGDELYTHHAHDKHRPQAFFTGEEDLQLAGVGVFSPAASQPPSPELARIKLTMFDGLESVKKISEERDGALLRQRPRQY